MNFVKYQILFDNFDSKTYIFVQFDFLSVFRVTDSLINFRTSLQPGRKNTSYTQMLFFHLMDDLERSAYFGIFRFVQNPFLTSGIQLASIDMYLLQTI